ncbi:MAG TPA: HD domain-containing phosphohydrolase [Candidatus Angelobacter sp.]|nr:HD domain-containing phosphohydrolase [Candidatus Angelobacter sp.]
MNSAASPKRRDTPGLRALPVLATFTDDPITEKYFQGVQRFRRLHIETVAAESDDAERIILISREEQVARYYNQLRVPNTRVLALSHAQFRDPRNDGAVYAYLPPDVPEALLERMVDNALDHIHLVHSRHEVNQRLAGASREIHELNQIGMALSAEHDPQKLLELILTKSREFTLSDAGSVYLVEGPEEGQHRSLLFAPAPGPPEPGLPDCASLAQSGMAVRAGFARSGVENGTPLPEQASHEQLRFKLAQNDTVALPFREAAVEINERSIAGYVALTGEIVNIEDAYNLPPGVPYAINRRFDEDSGYRTKSILAVPIRNQKEKIIAVLQLINAKRDRRARLDSAHAVEEHVVSFSARQQEIVLSLAGQAAVALENSQLYDSITRLFEGFVRAAVTAIETRDPATSGHSFRVANLTVALAEAVDRSESGIYKNVRFSRDQMREIRYASLLHDFGKVGVREEVLVKAKKLYPAQLEMIKQRFLLVRRTAENEALRSKVKYLLEKSREEYLAAQKTIDGALAGQLQQIDEYLEAVIWSNEPTVLPEGNFDRLLEIANMHYEDPEGAKRPVLTPDEIQMLSIRQGSLDEEERLQIEAHVVHTVSFLQQIPWTNELRNVPEIARGHHEKLNGQGYPYKLSAPEIPVQTRMMTISDIFDALAAADRPYKKAVSIERALEILDLSVKDGELDPGLFDIFLSARIFDRWKVEARAY